nr:hypothetical protein [Tanacetum cinerariifolium]
MGYFAKECRAPRSQDRGKRDNYRQGSKVKERALKALMAINGKPPTEFALMAKTSVESEVFDNSLCSKASLAQVESRLAEHKSRELKYCEKIRVLEFNTESRENCIESLTKDLELLKKKKGELETKLTGFQTASKDLYSLLKSQRWDKNKEGLGYSVVPPPAAQIYSPPKKDMSWTGLLEWFDKSKAECFNCHKMGYFAKECRAPRSQDRGKRDNYRQGSKVKERALKALMAINGVGWD